MVDLEGTLTNVNIYNLATIGTINMVSEAGTSLAVYSDNVNVFPDLIALFQLAAGSGGGPPPTSTTAGPTTLSTSTTTSTVSATGGWQFRGCYTDNVGGRTLGFGEPVPGGAGAMTVGACQTVCKGLGYTLAGVEYAQECCTSSIFPPTRYIAADHVQIATML
jgi:glucan 1,3-beta-glucosidase